MKWVNKGHEFDSVYQQIEGKRSFYLFGAGDYGRQFLCIMEKEIRIKGFLDNDPQKKGKAISGKPCYLPEEVKLAAEEGIIITMSQIHRVASIRQLEKINYVKNRDYFMIEDFLSIYHVYKNDTVYLSSISFLPGTVCNLKCRYCLNFNPFAKRFYVRSLEDLIKDVELFFACVDQVMLFHISGGEPLLCGQVEDLIWYIDQNYGHRIDTLRMITNGTVIPDDRVLEKISRCRVEIAVDDYRDAVPQYRMHFDELLRKLEKYKIRYFVNKAESWVDLAPEKTDHTGWTEEQLISHRKNCGQSWQELRGGKLYSCNYASYAYVAGITGEQDFEEAFDLTKHTPAKKKELVEFRLGYTEKGFTDFCRKCRGFTQENIQKFEPAIQTEMFCNWKENGNEIV